MESWTKKRQIELFSWKTASEFHTHGRKSHQKTCTWPKFDQKWYTLICTRVKISCFVWTCTLHMIFFLFLKCACFLHMSWNLESCVTLLSVCRVVPYSWNSARSWFFLAAQLKWLWANCCLPQIKHDRSNSSPNLEQPEKLQNSRKGTYLKKVVKNDNV